MKGYEYLIFDADHTVIDFDADERRAFEKAFEAAGIPHSADMVQACWEYSARNWHDLGLNDVHLPRIQENYHQLYHDHVRTLMEWVDTVYGLNGKRELAREVFERELCAPAHYIENADALIRELSAQYRICIATNGLTQMQHGRLAAIKPYLFRLYISEEMKLIKPQAAFFRYMLDDLKTKAQNCLMIGDSLSSDIAGANAAGIPCVWFDRRGLPAGERLFEKKIAHLCELKEYLK